MQKRSLLLYFLCLTGSIGWMGLPVFSQSVGVGTTTPHNSAILDMQSNKMGMLPPRMSWAQIKDIANPATGLIAFDTDSKTLKLFNGTAWVTLAERADELNDAPGNFLTAPYEVPDFGMSAINAVTVDANKNVYIGGIISSGSLTLGNTTITNVNLFTNLFFAKFDSSGQPLWVRSFGQNGVDDAVQSITTDPAGNVYIGGYFTGTSDFDTGPGVQTLTGSGTLTTAFYAKYDANGNWIWSKAITGGGVSSSTQAMVTDGVSLYIIGQFTGTATFNPASLTAFGSADIFVCRYQCSDGVAGATGWAKRIGSPSTETAGDIKLYLGNLLIGGSFSGNCNFGGISKVSAGGFDGFFAILFTTGVTSNVYEIGGTLDDRVVDVDFNPAGEIYCAGNFAGTCDFVPGAGTNNEFSAGAADGFIAHYNNSFTLNGFTQLIGNGGSDFITDIALDENNNVYAAGYFNGVGAINGFGLTSAGQNDMVLMKFGPDLYCEWVQQGGGTQNDALTCLAYIPGKQAVVAGAGSISRIYLDFKKKKHVGQFFLTWYYD
jgi:hypothetical protein